MNAATWIILLVVAGIAGMAARSIRKSKKNGNSCSCGCESCGLNCNGDK